MIYTYYTGTNHNKNIESRKLLQLLNISAHKLTQKNKYFWITKSVSIDYKPCNLCNNKREKSIEDRSTN